MKHPLYFAVVACFAVLLQACDHNTPAADPKPAGGGLLRIIKFKSPEYADFVVVEKTFNGDSCTLRPDTYPLIDLCIGSSPYMELPKGYYVVDWKWGPLIYAPSTFIIDVKWEELEDRRQKWDYTSIYITSNFFTLYGWASYKRIDSYLNIEATNPSDYTRPYWMSESLPKSFANPEYLPNKYMIEVRREDSLQNVYMERLSRIIEEGEFEKVLHKTW